MLYKVSYLGIIYTLTVALFVSCVEKFMDEDPSAFNRLLEFHEDITSAEDLMCLYYPFDYEAEVESPPPSITVVSLEDDRYQIKLIDDSMADDSVKAIKIIMLAQQRGRLWKVNSIKVNFKCWPGRGHRNWGVKLCR